MHAPLQPDGLAVRGRQDWNVPRASADRGAWQVVARPWREDVALALAQRIVETTGGRPSDAAR